MNNNLLMQYKEQSLNTMSKGEQLVALFDEALKNANYASLMYQNKNYETAEKCNEKCKSVFSYLISILDRSQPISSNLYQLYTFFNTELIRANVRRDHTIIEQIIPVIQEMRNTWAEANKLTHMNKR